jgi:hypothetical protein
MFLKVLKLFACAMPLKLLAEVIHLVPRHRGTDALIHAPRSKIGAGLIQIIDGPLNCGVIIALHGLLQGLEIAFQLLHFLR